MGFEHEFKALEKELLSEFPSGTISRDDVHRWMKSSEAETLGALYSLLHKEKHFSRIQPPLIFRDYHGFHLRYFEVLLVGDYDGEWTHPRYIIAHSFFAWFRGLWNDKSVSRDALRELKFLLSRLYRVKDDKLKLCIITGVLEHLFADQNIVRFFAEWRDDLELKAAYLEALSYAGNE